MSQETPRKRVMIVDPAPFVGGAERFAVDLAKHVNFSEFELWVAHGNNQEYERMLSKEVQELILEIPQLRLKNAFKIWKSIHQLRQIVKKHQIELIQSNSVRSHIVASLAVRKTKAKLIWFLHDFTFPGKLIHYFSRFPERILCCSDVVKNHVKKQLPKPFQAKLGRFLNGIDYEQIKGGWMDATFVTPHVIGMVGRIDRWKGQHYFIEAAEKVLQKKPEAKFLIIGEPNRLDTDNMTYFEELKQMIVKKNLEENVKFVGHQAAIFDIIRELSLLIHCSTDPEPFGRTVIEAMALGKVVIATDHGGPTETVQEGETGFLIPPKDSEKLAEQILQCLNAPEKMQKMGQKAKDLAKTRYDLKATTKAVETMWTSVLFK